MAHHEFELYLALEDIDHSKTQARKPQSTGIAERFHNTIRAAVYPVAFRKKIYPSIDRRQNAVDEWLQLYNRERTHTGTYSFGRTPLQTFHDTTHLAQQKLLATLFEAESLKTHSPAVNAPDPVRLVTCVRSRLVLYT